MTKYNKAQRGQIADAFRAARVRIANGDETYICTALDYTGHPGAGPAKWVVQIRLGGHPWYYTLEDWLRETPKVPPSKLTVKKMREYRTRWLDALIAEFSPSTKD